MSTGWIITVAGIVLGAFSAFLIYYGQHLVRQETRITTLPPIPSVEQFETLEPQQEKLLRLIHKYQVQFGARKLIIGRSGSLHFDEPERKEVNINIAEELLGSEGHSPARAREFEVIMESLPPNFLRMMPESRLDNPFVVTLTDAGRQYLGQRGPEALEPSKAYEAQWPETFTNKLDLSKGVPPNASFAEIQYFMESDDPRVPLEAEIASGPNGEGRMRVSGAAGVVSVMMREPQTAYYRLAHPKIKFKITILGFQADL
jgi:hypothetical protein